MLTLITVQQERVVGRVEHQLDDAGDEGWFHGFGFGFGFGGRGMGGGRVRGGGLVGGELDVVPGDGVGGEEGGGDGDGAEERGGGDERAVGERDVSQLFGKGGIGIMFGGKLGSDSKENAQGATM